MTVSQRFSSAYTELSVDDTQGWLDVFARDSRLEPRRRAREEPTRVFSGRPRLRRADQAVAR